MSKLIHFESDEIGDLRDFSGEEVIVTPSFVFFWKPPAVFGQWTESPFVIDGVGYCCAEQFMMAEKARLFGDTEVAAKILGTKEPKSHKALGRKVRGFDGGLWEARRLEIVIRGNVAKFSQNPEMRQALLDTETRELVEASPMDKIWGIGLRADNPAVTNKQRWKGLNLLGVALMETRRLLLESAQTTK